MTNIIELPKELRELEHSLPWPVDMEKGEILHRYGDRLDCCRSSLGVAIKVSEEEVKTVQKGRVINVSQLRPDITGVFRTGPVDVYVYDDESEIVWIYSSLENGSLDRELQLLAYSQRPPCSTKRFEQGEVIGDVCRIKDYEHGQQWNKLVEEPEKDHLLLESIHVPMQYVGNLDSFIERVGRTAWRGYVRSAEPLENLLQELPARGRLSTPLYGCGEYVDPMLLLEQLD